MDQRFVSNRYLIIDPPRAQLAKASAAKPRPKFSATENKVVGLSMQSTAQRMRSIVKNRGGAAAQTIVLAFLEWCAAFQAARFSKSKLVSLL